MGNYFNPPEAVRLIGRRLEFGTYAGVRQQMAEDEVLLVLRDHRMWWSCGHAYDEREYQAQTRFDDWAGESKDATTYRYGGVLVMELHTPMGPIELWAVQSAQAQPHMGQPLEPQAGEAGLRKA